MNADSIKFRNRRQMPKRVRRPAISRRGFAPKMSLGRLSACVGLGVVAVVLVVVVIILMFSNAILNGYGKGRIERAFAKAHPGCALRIGELHFSLGANRLIAQSVTLSATNMTVKAGRISVTGVNWAQVLRGTAALADVLAKASFDATNLDLEFPQSLYGIRCARLQVSVPGSELTAEGTELRTLVGDEEFFAAHDFRTTRFHVVVPECRVVGLAYDELLRGKSYRARSVSLSRPSFDALVNRDKPLEPFVKSPLMVHEALAAIPQPINVDSLSLTNGHLTYRERVAAGADPGVLTFGAVRMTVEGLANRGEPLAAIRLHAQGDLMEAATLKVMMTIPITPRDFSFHYSGSLSVMDLTRLDAFLDIAERTRIKSGSAQEAAFDINVVDGQARGWVQGIYRDLDIAVLDKLTDTEKGLNNRVASFLANLLKIRKSNAPDASGSMKEGQVNYARKPDDEFVPFAWFALRSGVLDLIGH
jgi:hypothetical protein